MLMIIKYYSHAAPKLRIVLPLIIISGARGGMVSYNMTVENINNVIIEATSRDAQHYRREHSPPKPRTQEIRTHNQN